MEGLHLVLGLRGHAPGRAADVYGFATFLLRACVLDDLRHLSLEAVDDGDDLVWVAVDDEADNLLPGDHLKLEGARRGDAPLLDALQREGAEDFAIDLYQLQAAFADVHIELSLEVACARGGGWIQGMRWTTRKKPRDATTVRHPRVVDLRGDAPFESFRCALNSSMRSMTPLAGRRGGSSPGRAASWSGRRR